MNYKSLIIVPIIVLALSTAYLFWLSSTTGLTLDIDLKGGTQIVAESINDVNTQDLEAVLGDYDANVRVAKGVDVSTIFIEFDAEIDSDMVINTLNENGFDFDNYSVQTVGTTLGRAFFDQALVALAVALVFMAIAAFVIFKKPVLSLRVVFSAAADIIETLVVSQMLGVKLSLATFAALLLLLGYSVDDDVLLTARVTRGTGEVKERLNRARKTAFTAIGTTSVALLALFVVIESTVIEQIASIMVIGLLFDLMNTWMFNAPILRWYAERGNK